MRQGESRESDVRIAELESAILDWKADVILRELGGRVADTAETRRHIRSWLAAGIRMDGVRLRLLFRSTYAPLPAARRSGSGWTDLGVRVRNAATTLVNLLGIRV
jgi:hypothetical protein